MNKDLCSPVRVSCHNYRSCGSLSLQVSRLTHMRASCPICGCFFPYMGILPRMSNLFCGNLMLPMHVYIHIHICIYTYTYVPMCKFIHMYMYIYIHILIRPSTHMRLYSHNQLDSYMIIYTFRACVSFINMCAHT